MPEHNPLAGYYKAKEWREAAIADGWTSKPTYEKESEERASTLQRNGFTAQIITRTPEPKPWNQHPKPEGMVTIWGPDRLSVVTPWPYDWQHIEAGLRRCMECGAKDVDTQRASFAGRVCSACLAMAKAKYEHPGWNN